jgi:phosphopantothenoylcysteine decarboxylase/phosphopantothenate--cysteine ligase
VKVLQKRGVKFVGPVVGSVACGEAGMGRMAPVEDILAAALEEFKG